MRIKFNSNLSFGIWGAVWALLMGVLSQVYDSVDVFVSTLPLFYWLVAGNIISDSIADKDWDNLKQILKWSLIIVVVLAIIFYNS